MKEKVLVIRRRVFEKIGVFQGICLEPEVYFKEIWSNHNAFFMDRKEAEDDAEYKQIIPYVVISYNNLFLSYVRGITGGESRLIKKRSIGFGGHINPTDQIHSSTCNKEMYLNALYREINEELILNTIAEDKIVGLINDDSNDVGRVHIGVVHNWILDNNEVGIREQDISELKFLSIGELSKIKDEMETWSQICFSHLKEML